MSRTLLSGCSHFYFMGQLALGDLKTVRPSIEVYIAGPAVCAGWTRCAVGVSCRSSSLINFWSDLHYISMLESFSRMDDRVCSGKFGKTIKITSLILYTKHMDLQGHRSTKQGMNDGDLLLINLTPCIPAMSNNQDVLLA